MADHRTVARTDVGERIRKGLAATGRGLLARLAAWYRGLGVVGKVSLVICGIYCIFAVFGPTIVPVSPTQLTGGTPFQGPSTQYWLGLDELGRSVFSQVIVGARVAIIAALLAVAVSAVTGTALGVIAGYSGGIVDHVTGWLFDLLFSIPCYLLGILVVVVAGPGLIQASLAIGVAFIPQFGRVARGAAIDVRGRSYVEAAVLAGRGQWWVIRKHILRNIMTPIAVMIGLTLANAEGAYAVLSYLGFGVAPPMPDYGNMIAAGQGYMTTDPTLVLFPCAALVVLIVGFALLGDWIAEQLDPYRRTLSIGWGR